MSTSTSRGNVQYKITPGALVCNEAEIAGNVTIGVRTVVHPKAKIIAESGPIIIGDGNLIEEQAVIINRSQNPLTIGHNNVFEIGTHVEAIAIGDNNVFEAKTVVGPHVEVTHGCVVGALCKLTGTERIAENTIIFGQNNDRRRAAERPAPQMLQLDFLTKILPNYHHLKGRGK